MTDSESGSATIRNLSLALAAAIGLPLAIWRSAIAERQADVAYRQSETAMQSLSNEQFKTGVELLGHRNMAVRLGGVYSLVDMAKLQPETHHIRVMEIFAAFLTYPPRYSGGQSDGEIDFESADTLRIINAISDRTPIQIQTERSSKFDLEEILENTHFPIENGKVQIRSEISEWNREVSSRTASPPSPPPPPSPY